MAKGIRFIRAVLIALWLTLRGQQPVGRYPAINTWITQADALLTQVMQAAERAKFDAATHQALKVKIDGRMTSMESILKGLHYHLHEEYPYVLRNETLHDLTAIRSSNLNDQYRVTRLLELSEIMQASELATALTALTQHLAAFPETTVA